MKKTIFTFAMAVIIFTGCNKCLECGNKEFGAEYYVEICKNNPSYKCAKKGECNISNIYGETLTCK